MYKSSSFIKAKVGFLIHCVLLFVEQIRNCDGILSNMEQLLGKFQSDLGRVSEEIRQLQVSKEADYPGEISANLDMSGALPV